MHSKTNKSFLIAAPWSNSGKTLLTLGLSRYYKKQGYRIQNFKCGPDYIDTIHHTNASGNTSVNLDSIMMSDSHLQEVYERHSSQAEITIVEGVMGLFDGAKKDKGSTAEIAKKLGLPIILVVNAKAMAHTVAALLHGLKTFDPDIQIAGVVFNFVKTASHYTFLKEACESVDLKALGYITPHEALNIPSRHLGLHIDQSFEETIEKAANHVAHIGKTIIEQLDDYPIKPIKKRIQKEKGALKIAIAKDDAFRFTYAENLHYLRQLGQLTFFSPMRDKKLPPSDIIYLAGGYPELHLAQLSKNKEMITAITKAAEAGTKIIAECGGMMYLGKSIIDEEGKDHPMVGVFDFSTSMENKKLHLGYRKVHLNDQEVWGHEFHYSSVLDDEQYPSIAQVYTARNRVSPTKIYRYNNVMASYIHLYWGENGRSLFQ